VSSFNDDHAVCREIFLADKETIASLREQLRLAQEQLKQTRAMLELAAELLPVPEHNQGDQWFEDQGKITEFLAAPPTKVEGST
jgi:hypothetical protein